MTLLKSAAPASDHLFQTQHKKIIIKETQDMICHSLISKELFSIKRARSDVHNTVELIIMQVRSPDKYEWKKLVHMIGVLCRTTKLPINICSDIINIVKWWVYRTRGVHNYCIVHSSNPVTRKGLNNHHNH